MADQLLCAGATIVRPEDALAENCPVLTKERAAICQQGVATTVEWQLRDSNGNPIDLTACDTQADSATSLDSEIVKWGGEVVVRFADAIMPLGCTAVVNGTVVDGPNGLVRFVLPAAVYNEANIYQCSIGISNLAGEIVHVTSGLISVERSLFGFQDQVYGPPTLQEIRLQIRDTVVENSLLAAIEYSDAEIIYSLTRPLREFLETPPPITQQYTAKNFPWHNAWLNATIANLLKIAADSYRRNRLATQQGGVVIDDKNKEAPYMQAALLLSQEWKEFVIRKKAQLNAENAMGSIRSGYGYGY